MRDHRSLVAWQVARALVGHVMAITRDYYQPRLASVFSQLQRASLSVQLNIAEGYARQSSRSFRHHLTIAYGSAVETAELLDLCMSESIVPEIGRPASSKAMLQSAGPAHGAEKAVRAQRLTCHLSPVTCHLSPLTFQLLHHPLHIPHAVVEVRTQPDHPLPQAADDPSRLEPSEDIVHRGWRNAEDTRAVAVRG